MQHSHAMNTKKTISVSMYITTSLEGYIADEYGDTSWAQNGQLLEQTVRKYGLICMGRTMFKEYGNKAFADVVTIVLTHRPPNKAPSRVYFVTSVAEALACAQEQGFTSLLVVGGAQTNQSFMQAAVVRTVYADIHPILLKGGLPMYGHFKAAFDFKIKHQTVDEKGFIHAEYSIGKIHKATATVVIRDADGRYFIHAGDDTWEIGVTSDVDALEDPIEAAKRACVRSMYRVSLLHPYGRFSYTSQQDVYVFEITVNKQKKYRQSAGRTVAWVTGEELNRYIAESKVGAVAAAVYDYYKSQL